MNAPDPTPVPAQKSGPPCSQCGSTDTTIDSLLRSKPSVLGVIFFGWLFLLIKGAFATRNSFCRSCGASKRYKSIGSWIALLFLTLIVVLVICALLSERAA